MTEFWWSCPWCSDRMTPRHTQAEAEADRDAHMANHHPFVVAQAEHMTRISFYKFREVHQ